MGTNEIFSRVVSAVATASDISEEVIVSDSKRVEVVDARYICIMLLHRRGFTHRRIGEHFGISRQAVSYVLRNFDGRLTGGGSINACIYGWAVKILAREEEADGKHVESASLPLPG